MYTKDQNAFLSIIGNNVTDMPFRTMVNSLAQNNPYTNVLGGLGTPNLGGALREAQLTIKLVTAMHALKDLVIKSVPVAASLFDSENNFASAIVTQGKTSINDQYTAGTMPTVSQTLNVTITISSFIDIVFCVIPQFDTNAENRVSVSGVDDIFFVVKTKLMNGSVQEYHVLPEQSKTTAIIRADADSLVHAPKEVSVNEKVKAEATYKTTPVAEHPEGTEVKIKAPTQAKLQELLHGSSQTLRSMNAELIKNLHTAASWAFLQPKEDQDMQQIETTEPSVHELLKAEFNNGRLQSTDFKRSVYGALNAWKEHYDVLSTGMVDSFIHNETAFEEMAVSVSEADKRGYPDPVVIYSFKYDLDNGAQFVIDVERVSNKFLVDDVAIYILLKNNKQLNHLTWNDNSPSSKEVPYEAAHGFLVTVAEIELDTDEPTEAPDDVTVPEKEPHGNIVGRHMSVIDMLEKLETITNVTELGETMTKLDKDDMFAKLAVALTKWAQTATSKQIYSVKNFVDNEHGFTNMDAVIDAIDKKGFTVHFKYSTRGDNYFNIAAVFEFEKESHTVKSVEVFETQETNGKVEVVGFALDESDFKVRIKESQTVIRCYRFYFKKLAELASQQNKESKAIAELVDETKERTEKQAVEAYASSLDSLIRGILGKDAPEELIAKVNQVVLGQYATEAKKQVEQPQCTAGIGDSRFLVTRLYKPRSVAKFGNTVIDLGIFDPLIKEAKKPTWKDWEKLLTETGLIVGK